MIAFINVFHVAPVIEQRAVDILIEITERFISKAPGFLSSTLHRSPDGTKLVMYALWRSQADYDAMRRDPSPSAALSSLVAISQFESATYEIVQSFTGVVN